MDIQNNWLQSPIQYFWNEIAEDNHLIQLYENENAFLNILEGFAGSGFLAGESVIVIATNQHLAALNKRLLAQGFEINKLIARDHYMPMDAEETLQNFMTDNGPDEKKFMRLATGIVNRARKERRKVRAFGEMVALLWHQNKRDATRKLEDLWNDFCSKEHICVFCAYPQTGMINNSLEQICCKHTKIISGKTGPTTQILYKSITPHSKISV